MLCFLQEVTTFINKGFLSSEGTLISPNNKHNSQISHLILLSSKHAQDVVIVQSRVVVVLCFHVNTHSSATNNS